MRLARFELKGEAHAPAELPGGGTCEHVHLVPEPLPTKFGKFLSVGVAVGGPHAQRTKLVAGLVPKRSLKINGCDAKRAGVQSTDRNHSYI